MNSSKIIGGPLDALATEVEIQTILNKYVENPTRPRRNVQGIIRDNRKLCMYILNIKVNADKERSRIAEVERHHD